MRFRDRAGRPVRTRLFAISVMALLVLGGGMVTGRSATARQDATPAAGTVSTPEASPAVPATNETAPDVGSPYQQTIAQGLIFLEGGEGVWRVREITPPGDDVAISETGPASFTLQRSGVSIIRNDLSERRARIEAGEGYFMTGDDPYTRRAEGATASRAWVIELLSPDAQSVEGEFFGDVFFTSDPIAELPNGTYDMELIRNVLLPGDTASLADHTGPALVMVTTGTIQTSDGGTFQARGGLLAEGNLTLTNATDQTAVYVVAALGERVFNPGEAEEPATDATPVAEETPTEAPAELDPAADPDQDGLTNGEEAELGTDPFKVDTDDDGLADADEVASGTSPTSFDTDADGLGDLDEITTIGTDALNPDTDADGFTDGNENELGTDPFDPNSFPQ